MWHASAAKAGSGEDALRAIVEHALNGYGDAATGEWREWSGRAYHLRRRLTAQEARRIGPTIDVRGTPEAVRRMNKVRRYLPPGWGAEV